MLKHTALAAILTLAIAGPVAAQQTSGAQGRTRRPAVQRIVRNFQFRIRHGVRTGRITQDELARLRTDLAAFRTKVQALKQVGAKPTPEQRAEVRQGLRGLNREIRLAIRGR
jgi:hypothetical protein